MPRRRTQLTAGIQEEICAFIRAGAFPHVAAEAAGVPLPVFRQWMTRGRKGGRGTRFRCFRAAVLRARAQARVRAEVEVYQNSPLLWLKHGPGRERRGSPGWTNPAKPAVRPTGGPPTNLLEIPGIQQMVANVLDALTPFPDARTKAASVLAALARRGA